METNTSLGLMCAALGFMNIYKAINTEGMKGILCLAVSNCILFYVAANVLL